MKKILLITVIAMSLVACKQNAENTKTTSENDEMKIEVKTESKNTLSEKKATIDFEDYKIDFKETTEKAKIDFNSNLTARGFKTVISEMYKSGSVDFAGHYITATWGCGTSCISGAMIDVRDGKVYDLPSDDDGEGLGNAVDTRKESSLLVTSISGVPFGDDTVAIEKYWKWNEAAKKFEFLKTVEIKDDSKNMK